MNKDVIYIEPEQDITDIIANIKASKHKIIALVPPKKAGVLRSAVNFKLIAKTARQNEKTVVLITADESLRRLASSVAMPTAKTLQSKPQLPDDDDAVEFGDEMVTDEESEEEEEEEKETPAPAKKVPVTTAVKVKNKPAAPADDVIEGEPEPEEEKEPKNKAEKKVAKMKGAKIPNIAKYRKFIIAGAVALVIFIPLILWASIIAPAAKITVKVRMTDQGFNEKVTFVNDESKADAESGVLFLEEQTINKKAEGEFSATGEVDKGTKATGKVSVTLPINSVLSNKQTISIPKGTTFTINGKAFETTEGASVPIKALTTDLQNTYWKFCDNSATTKCAVSDISSGDIPVAAKEVGEGSNIAAANSGITSSVSFSNDYKIKSTAMTGGTSKKVKVVSKEDVENASSNLTMPSQSEIREELSQQFGAEYVLLGDIKQSEAKITTSPALNEEVGDNVTPKIVKEVSYTMYAVKRDQVEKYIKAVITPTLGSGDDTQEIYDSGASKAFFESFKNSDNENTAKLKATVKVGPSVTDQMVREKCLGYKVGECQSRLKSIKGVSSTKINTSYFFVTSVPGDTNKVEVVIENEE